MSQGAVVKNSKQQESLNDHYYKYEDMGENEGKMKVPPLKDFLKVDHELLLDTGTRSIATNNPREFNDSAELENSVKPMIFRAKSQNLHAKSLRDINFFNTQMYGVASGDISKISRAELITKSKPNLDDTRSFEVFS